MLAIKATPKHPNPADIDEEDVALQVLEKKGAGLGEPAAARVPQKVVAEVYNPPRATETTKGLGIDPAWSLDISSKDSEDGNWTS